MNKKSLYPYSSIQNSLEGYFFRISTRSKIIYWIIIGVFFLIIIVLPVLDVDISVQARGFFQADIEKQTINAPVNGRVIYSSIHTGNQIEKGDTLVIIESETLSAQKEVTIQKIKDNNAFISDLHYLIGMSTPSEEILSSTFKTQKIYSEFANFTKQYKIQLQKASKISSDYQRISLLHQQELIPDVDFENSKYQLEVEQDNLNHLILSQEAIWQADLTMCRNDSIILFGELRQIDEELNNRIVISPVKGEVIRSTDIQTGGFIYYNQVLAEISPESELLATCFVKPSDIGFLYENQPVRIQVDAFRHAEWGMLTGYISDISDDMIIESNSSAFFRVKCILHNKSLSLKNGYTAEVKKGMSLTARMHVTKRSLFNLLFDKVDKWFNPYMINRNTNSNADQS